MRGNLEGLGAELLRELGADELVEVLPLHPDDPRRAEPVLPRLREPEHHVLVPASVPSDEENVEERVGRQPKGRVVRPDRGRANECLRKVVDEHVLPGVHVRHANVQVVDGEPAGPKERDAARHSPRVRVETRQFEAAPGVPARPQQAGGFRRDRARPRRVARSLRP